MTTVKGVRSNHEKTRWGPSWNTRTAARLVGKCRAGVLDVDPVGAGTARPRVRPVRLHPRFLVEGASPTDALPVVSAPRPPPNCKDSGLWRIEKATR